MKNSLHLILPVCIILTGIITGCESSTSREIDIIHIEGVDWACNVTTSYATFGSTSEDEDQNEVTLAASKGDMLYMLWEDLEFYYRYSPQDGQVLSVLFDTLSTVSVYLNGELDYMELSGSSVPAAFMDLTKLEMSQLSTLCLKGSLTKELIPILEQRETQLRRKGLVLETESESEDLSKLLSIYQPEFLVLEDPWQLPAPDKGYVPEGLELLWIQEYSTTLARTAQCCGDLESLILSEWEVKEGELLPLSSMENLQNLTLAESDLSSLQNIEFPEGIHSLNLINCTSLSSIDQILLLPKLCRLNLTGAENVNQVEMLQGLTPLRWISLPANTTQKEFQELTKHLTQLEVVELIGCTEISDLHPLQALENLSILALNLDKEQLAGLESLNQLHMLIVTDKLFNDNPEYIKDLRSSLPNSNIVPGSGLCLGSAWLLLLLPLILLFRFTLRRKV